MYIVGITGPIGHGKTTLAEILASLEPDSANFESSLLISEVINMWHQATQHIPAFDDMLAINTWVELLIPILQEHLHVYVSADQLAISQADITQRPIDYSKLADYLGLLDQQPGLLQQAITPTNKDAYRTILQWLGSYLVAKVGPGVWYDELVRRVKQANVQLCTVGGVRYPGDATILKQADAIIVKVYRPGYGETDQQDPTERQRNSVKADCIIINGSSLEGFQHTIKLFYDDLRHDALKSTYGEDNQ